MNEPSPEALENFRVLAYQEFKNFQVAVQQGIAPDAAWMGIMDHHEGEVLLEVLMRMTRTAPLYPGPADELCIRLRIMRGQPGSPIEFNFATAEGQVLSAAPTVPLNDYIQADQTIAPSYQEWLRAYLMAQVGSVCRFLLDEPVGDKSSQKWAAEHPGEGIPRG